MKLYHMADPLRFPRMTTEELRSTFLLSGLAQPGKVALAYVDLDRAVVGFASPLAQPLALETPAELRAEYFLERREMGALNIGGKGSILADGRRIDASKLDTIYLGRGTRAVVFESEDASDPAVFYLLSYPAHASYPTAQMGLAELTPLQLGSVETCNRRSIYKSIYDKGMKSCQLVMGFTLLERGSNWNTIPPHTHARRSEVYLYFDLPEERRIVHLMGPPDETRHLLVANREIVFSPGWSIHAGVGTSTYGFCWLGQGGENQAYDDMDPSPIRNLR
jgi:4-deoxy-L-threo-5-hexosulose-uronate ketol-isomerase